MSSTTDAAAAIDLSPLRDVQMRFENGLLVQLWFVLPRHLHDVAIKKALALAQRTRCGPSKIWPKCWWYVGPIGDGYWEIRLMGGIPADDPENPKDNDGCDYTEIASVQQWYIEQDGSMVTATFVCEED